MGKPRRRTREKQPGSPTMAHDRHVDYRREVVASCALKRMSLRAIAEELARQGVVNPDNGRPYSHETVRNDLAYLSQQWQANAQRTINELRAEMLAELDEIKRHGWTAQDLSIVLRAIDRQAKLLGADAPASSHVELSGGIDISTAHEDAARTLERLIAQGAAGDETE